MQQWTILMELCWALLEENKRQTDWLKKIHDKTKNKGTTQAPGEAVFA